MITINQTFPAFNLTGVAPDGSFAQYAGDPGKWRVVFFWPMDFTFVCPTEIAAFSRAAGDFADRDTEVLGVSTDTHFVHKAWRDSHADLKDLAIPMLADTKKELSSACGILTEDGVAMRATFIIDPDGIVRWVNVTDGKVGRSVEETLRVLDALQTDELCPCNWKKGESTLVVK
jgi:lipoyl-dependent peroxiredoxin subunit C